jgi:WD40 repeat protein
MSDALDESTLTGTPPVTTRFGNALAPGTVVSHYEIIRPLGRGGMGKVYLARDVRLGRLVALKFLAEAAHIPRFVSEARATARLTHENIIALHDIDYHDNVPYMVLEFINGETLANWIRSRRTDTAAGPPVPPSRVVALMAPVLRALVCAHDAGIVHRDLKPSNIMLSHSGLVKVLDFGLAKLVQEAASSASAPDRDSELPTNKGEPLSTALTHTGYLVGTMAYMSPEQWNRAEVDHLSDLWAVGVILYELVVGRHPLAGLAAEALAAVGNLDVAMPSVRELFPESAKLGALIDQCLVKRKEDRIGSARQLLAELESIGKPAPRGVAEEQNPYPGLAAFQERDCDWFYGRERAIADVVTRFCEQPLVAIVGPSGAGKSSFVRAGVIPALKREETWESFVVRPGARPLAAIADLLLQHSWSRSDNSTPEPHNGAGKLQRDAVGEQLLTAPGFLGVQLRARARRRRERVVLFIDQLEELYTLAAPAERQAFWACLSGVADDIGSPVRVIVSMRSDFLDRIAEAPPSILDAMSRNTIILRPLDREGLRRALVQPSEAAEVRFESGALVDDMLDALADTTGALPILQFTAAELWARRDVNRRMLTMESYRAIGGVAGALARHADATLAPMRTAERRWARTLFLRLVTIERTRAVVTVRELRELGGEHAADIDRLVARLVDARLLTIERGHEDQSTVEIVHESLIDGWPLLSAWLDEENENTQFLARLRAAAQDWEASGHTDGLLWRDRAADEASAWLARRKTGAGDDANLNLSRREEQYLRSVVALAERSRRRRRRNVIALLGTISAIAVVVSLLAVRATREAARADAEAMQARNATRISAARELQADPTTALALLREVEPGYVPHSWFDLAFTALHSNVALAVLPHPEPVYSATFSPDGKHIVTACEDKLVRVWRDDGSGTPLVLAGHTGVVTAASFSPDGARVASAAKDGTVRIWRVQGGGAPMLLRAQAGALYSVAFSRDGTRLVTASEDGTAQVWHSDGSGAPIILRGHRDQVSSADFSPDGRRIVTASADGTARVWNADGSGDPIVLRGHEHVVSQAAFSPDGRQIATASWDGTARVWNADGTGSPIKLRGHDQEAVSVAFSPDGTRIATGSGDNTARVWSADGTGVPVVLRGHSAAVFSVAFSPDGEKIVTASWDKTVRVWSSHRRTDEPIVFAGHQGLVGSVAFSPDGKHLVTGSDDKLVRVWNADGTGAPLLLRGHSQAVCSARYSPDGTRIVSASQDHTARVSSADGSGPPLVLRGHEDTVFSAVFSPDGGRIATASGDKTVRVWSADGTGTPLVLRGHEARVSSVAFSPDGKQLVTASYDKTVRVWNADGSGTPLILRGHQERVNSAEFSPDGKRIISISWDKTALIWNADGSGTPLVINPREGVLIAGSFSSDGTHILTAADDKAVWVWSADGKGEPLVLHGSRGVTAAVFSPDGRSVAAALQDQTVWRWTDLIPLSGTDDRRLWTATPYCFSVEQRVALLGISEVAARAQYDACRRRVDGAGRPTGNTNTTLSGR